MLSKLYKVMVIAPVLQDYKTWTLSADQLGKLQLQRCDFWDGLQVTYFQTVDKVKKWEENWSVQHLWNNWALIGWRDMLRKPDKCSAKLHDITSWKKFVQLQD
jgi:hypothetical protein